MKIEFERFDVIGGKDEQPEELHQRAVDMVNEWNCSNLDRSLISIDTSIQFNPITYNFIIQVIIYYTLYSA